jgi:hypothetical protein
LGLAKLPGKCLFVRRTVEMKRLCSNCVIATSHTFATRRSWAEKDVFYVD